jgi:hypothetical protein
MRNINHSPAFLAFARESGMQKAYFHVREGDKLIKDPEGTEFMDLAEAKKVAEESLHEMLAEDIGSQRPIKERSIEITSDHGELLAKVTIRAFVKMEQETGS